MIDFDDALERALDFFDEHRTALGPGATIIRDVIGRLGIVAAASAKTIKTLAPAFARSVGPWSRAAAQAILPAELVGGLQALQNDPDRTVIRGIPVIERMLVARDWTQPPLPDAPPRIPRAVLYGIKGGTGRSTALAIWALHLARQHGKRVLVVDLDIESPGIGSSLLARESHPRYGFVDCLVEAMVGQGPETIRQCYAQAPPALDTGAGSIVVVPANGNPAGYYPQKLARAYAEIAGPRGELLHTAERMAQVLDLIEAEVRPDVVLIDSRAGLHDIAATALTRLGARLVLLFAVGTRQTWDGYRLLFEHWQRWAQEEKVRPHFNALRESLQIVAAQVPETGTAEYLGTFVRSSQALFENYLDEPAGEIRATHLPLRIDWSRRFLAWEPLDETVEPQHVQASFGQFLRKATASLLNLQEPTELSSSNGQIGYQLLPADLPAFRRIRSLLLLSTPQTSAQGIVWPEKTSAALMEAEQVAAMAPGPEHLRIRIDDEMGVREVTAWVNLVPRKPVVPWIIEPDPHQPGAFGRHPLVQVINEWLKTNRPVVAAS
jgi:hypothetical protein